ncbi:zinc finger CCCH domain-containing protein 25 [Cannabis sativa]|uniref:zinc finger CCCH domain-containing protein 25 n=1 Tax=Cannabis sativa TaxID=3483 RepID=UPI0029C9F60B|nr:zinc finger CCCH domain-containing protein 25 [Cannabis sativa]
MNPLTLVKRIQNINAKEATLGISEEASWHAKYKDSAYVYVGGIPFDLTEGDLLAVFAQYGEILDVNLVRDKGTGKSKGFAFVAYEDQRSTNLAVDNLNGAQVLGRTIRVDHVTKYKKKEEEDEETEQKKREARGVCRAFQKGECTRGAGCKFSHDEKRAANTGWGDKDKESRWGHDRFDGPKTDERRSGNNPFSRGAEHTVQEGNKSSGFREQAKETIERDFKQSNRREKRLGSQCDDHDLRTKDRDSRERSSRRPNGNDYEPNSSEDNDKREKKRSGKHDDEEVLLRSRGHDRKEERRPRGHGDDVPKTRNNFDRREEKRSRRDSDYDFEPRSREEQDVGEERRMRRHNADDVQVKMRSYQDKREGERSRRHDYDDIEPTRARRDEKRLSRPHNKDQLEPRLHKENERDDNRRSRTNRT